MKQCKGHCLPHETATWVEMCPSDDTHTGAQRYIVVLCMSGVERSSETTDLHVLLYSHPRTITRERDYVNVPIVHLMERMILIQPRGTYSDWVRLF